jgi:DNA-binding response OmpR family regulator
LKILLVEDERKLAEAVAEGLQAEGLQAEGLQAEGLQAEGYTVTLAPSGEDALSSTRQHPFDLILLDVMLPGRSGLEVLEEMRRTGLKSPVLILTSRDSIEDRVLGLDVGADDYLVESFAFPELLADSRANAAAAPRVRCKRVSLRNQL